MIDLQGIRHGFPGIEWEMNIREFSLRAGEVLGIIGLNGSGKTTLLRIAAGLETPREGTVHLNNHSLARWERRRVARILGYLPQEVSSEYDLHVEDLVRMGRYPHIGGWGRLDKEDLQAVENSLELTGMALLRRRRLSQLSGGEKKRAFLASVLAQQPRFLLLDEPTAALDLSHQVRFFRLLHRLSRDGMGIAVVTHDVNLASLHSDRMLWLEAGQVLAAGPPHEVITEERVLAVYGCEVWLERHPESQRPMVIARSIPEDAP
jgi:iron complex transport system ATP-binding protein